MLSVRGTAITAEKVAAEFELCSCSVPLVLPNTVLFLYEQEANLRSRKPKGVVTTLTGIPPEIANIYNRTHLASAVRVVEYL